MTHPTPRPALVDVVAACLGLKPDQIEPTVPLSRYGMDSLAAVQLHVDLATATGRELPDGLLLDCPHLAALERFLETGRSPAQRTERLERMRSDCVLPPEIRPDVATRLRRVPRTVFLSGATGFLGAHLLTALLRDEHTKVICLVRPHPDGDGRSRLAGALAAQGTGREELPRRVEVVEGDLSRSRFGLSADAFQALAERIDRIYHSAADVDWVQPYEALRETNVIGTMETLRLACRDGATPLHFISTIGACLATPGPETITEEYDAASHLDGLHFGYVQTKCVAETLVRRAAERGLPVSIYRPSLISGHSRSGFSETQGFLSSFLKGCIRMRSAPDLDWMLDCCPVDHVAESVLRLSGEESAGLCVHHLDNVHARHWRECVLWLNLYGYPVRLLSYREWLRRLEAEAGDPEHPLHALRSFFSWRPHGLGGLTLPELFERGRKPQVVSTSTQAALSSQSLHTPPLTAHLLERYFDSFVERGFLRTPSTPSSPRQVATNGRLSSGDLATVFRRFFDDDTIEVNDLSEHGSGSEYGILSELSSWRYGRTHGLSRYSAALVRDRGPADNVIEFMIKMKPRDREIIEIGQKVADVCGPTLGQAYGQFKHRVGLERSHVRELAIYAQQDPRFRRHTPICYGTLCDDRRRTWALVLERLSNTVLMDSVDRIDQWRSVHIEAAIRGLAELHALWWGREDELAQQRWLGHVFSTRTMVETTELWTALARHATRLYVEWMDDRILATQMECIDKLGSWWRELEDRPRTLIHNDFNPRNITFRREGEDLRLCAYDWELATLGVPQHDLAELLCFVMPPDPGRAAIDRYVELHRTALEQATGDRIDPARWRRGFVLSLDDLLINRFGMYAMIHTCRPLKFLKRVLQTWWEIRSCVSRSG